MGVAHGAVTQQHAVRTFALPRFPMQRDVRHKWASILVNRDQAGEGMRAHDGLRHDRVGGLELRREVDRHWEANGMPGHGIRWIAFFPAASRPSKYGKIVR